MPEAGVGPVPGVGSELVLTREFDAPRELVFRAWTEPERLAVWWGPAGYTNPRCEIDVRPGGAIRIDMCGPDGIAHPMLGAFREVVPPERLVFTGGAADAGGRLLFEVENTVTLTDLGGRTGLTPSRSSPRARRRPSCPWRSGCSRPPCPLATCA